jgi:drug/metabolite transporter (DMT)-like permease
MAAATYTIPAIVILLSWLLLSQLPAPLSFLGGTICLAGAATTWLRRPRVVHADLSRLLRRCRGCAVRGWRRRQGQL